MDIRCKYCGHYLLHKNTIADKEVYECKGCKNVYLIDKDNKDKREFIEKGSLTIRYEKLKIIEKILYLVSSLIFIICLFFVKFNIVTLCLFAGISFFILKSIPNFLFYDFDFHYIMKYKSNIATNLLFSSIIVIITAVILLFTVIVPLECSDLYEVRNNKTENTKNLSLVYTKNKNNFYLAQLTDHNIDFYYYYSLNANPSEYKKIKVSDINSIKFINTTKENPKIVTKSNIREKKFINNNFLNKFVHKTTTDWKKDSVISEDTILYIPKDSICTGLTEEMIVEQKEFLIQDNHNKK